ncbi:glycosyltransferase family protein [Aurantimicrobium minutum]|uniref:glycosyltransferase family protein n=1 Tax=Aurantimicrobium minutum TaxID=708131 RepID=UPI002473746E|nr:glycosyltransferase family protein [Aurantimicrobium minutum]MDH6536591.1 spore coat polysaccharide biosynthesis protein SpsF [Aurantimicrobium minutum]
MAESKDESMILAILQGRLSSTRLPGKVLKDLHGEPMILRQIERLKHSQLIDQLVVATSVDASDDKLVAVLEDAGIEVRRGPLDDVVERFGIVVDEFNPETIVRLTADCPLADVQVIDEVISAHIEKHSDYTSNVLEPTFPDGLDVECISASAFAELRKSNLSIPEREHVTLGLYSHPDNYSLSSITQAPNLSSLRWTVDVQDDLDFVRLVYGHLYDENKYFGQKEIFELLQLHPEISRTDVEVARNSGSNK